jgi:thiomorpholine-carboxylate dehydrogenase
MHFFDEAEIADVLHMADLIPVMRRAMIDFSTGRIAQPAHRLLEVEPYGGYFAAMPAAGADAVGAKLVTFYPGNAEKGLHTDIAPSSARSWPATCRSTRRQRSSNRSALPRRIPRRR